MPRNLHKPANCHVPMPPADNRNRDLKRREVEFLTLLLNDTTMDFNKAAEKVGFGPNAGYAVASRWPVLNAMVKDGQVLHVKWRELMEKSKNRLQRILDDDEASAKDIINCAKVVFEAIYKTKAVSMAEAADKAEGDAVGRILGEYDAEEATKQ